jgi:hypothetical protein
MYSYIITLPLNLLLHGGEVTGEVECGSSSENGGSCSPTAAQVACTEPHVSRWIYTQRQEFECARVMKTCDTE